MCRLLVLFFTVLVQLNSYNTGDDYQLSTFVKELNNDRLNIICVYDRNQDKNAQFTWFRKDGSVVSHYSNAVISKSDLVNNGPFVCEVSNENGEKYKAGLTYDSVLKPAQYVTTLHTLRTTLRQAGKGAVLDAIVSPLGPGDRVTYLWKKDGVLLGNQRTYTIQDVTVSQGTYICEVLINESHPLKGSINVQIKKTQSTAVIGTMQRYPGANFTVNFGDRIEIHCDHNSGKILSSPWKLNDQTLRQDDMLNLNLRRTDLASSSVMSIAKATHENEGAYQCSFYDKNNNRVTLYGNVRVKSNTNIQMEPKEMKITEGERLSIHCTISGSNSLTGSNISWKFQPEGSLDTEDVDTSFITHTGSSSYYEKIASSSDAGTYYCRANFNGKWILSTSKVMIDMIIRNEESVLDWDATGDEEVTTLCLPDQRKCNNGQCLDRGRFCDGKTDCTDGSDEFNCSTCDPIIRKCENHLGKAPTADTYNVNWECDGDDDCGNGFDEADCPDICDYRSRSGAYNRTTFTCPASQQVIPRSFICDDSTECTRGEDEFGCRAPEIISRVERLYEARVGGTVTLECEATGNPLPRIIWRYNWGCLPGQSAGESQFRYLNLGGIPRYRVENSIKNCGVSSSTAVSKLTISNVQFADSALYNCEAISGAKRAMSMEYDFKVKEQF